MKTLKTVIILVVLVAAAFFLYTQVQKQEAMVEETYGTYAFTSNEGTTGSFSYTSEDREEMTLTVEGNSYELSRAVSGSGARYTNDDESVVFWEHQGEATIEINGELVFTLPQVEEATLVTFNIEPQTQACEGVGPMNCLVVNGELFYDSIEGFNFEEGMEYELLVAQSTRTNVPADASVYHYRLVEVVKAKATSSLDVDSPLNGSAFSGITNFFNIKGESNSADLTETKWRWTGTQFSDGTSVVPNNNGDFVASFGAGGNFSSTTDCNNTGGEYSVNGENLAFGALISTMMYCEGSVEGEYGAMLSQVESFTIDANGILVLTLTDDGGVMLFTPDTTVESSAGTTMHPSWDQDGDGMNDCENDGSCDHTVDYTTPRGEVTTTLQVQ